MSTKHQVRPNSRRKSPTKQARTSPANGHESPHSNGNGTPAPYEFRPVEETPYEVHMAMLAVKTAYDTATARKLECADPELVCLRCAIEHNPSLKGVVVELKQIEAGVRECWDAASRGKSSSAGKWWNTYWDEILGTPYASAVVRAHGFLLILEGHHDPALQDAARGIRKIIAAEEELNKLWFRLNAI